MLLELLIASGAIMLASLIGVLSFWRLAGNLIERNLHYLVSFAAGVFFVLVLLLSEEVLTHARTELNGLLWIVGGLIGVWFITKLFPEAHCHEGEECDAHGRIDARRLIIGDSFHNIGDGILLAVAFLASSALGIAAAVSILFHELVQEISEFFVLRKAGYSTRGALKINFLTSATILIGALGGFFLLEEFEALEIPVLGIAAGALLALLLEDLLPHSFAHAKQKKYALGHITAIILGAILMFGIFDATSESHSHESGFDHHEEEHLGDVHHADEEHHHHEDDEHHEH